MHLQPEKGLRKASPSHHEAGCQHWQLLVDVSYRVNLGGFQRAGLKLALEEEVF